MSKMKGPTKTVYREVVEGHFVTKDYAEKHPRTTEKERVHIQPPSRPSKKK